MRRLTLLLCSTILLPAHLYAATFYVGASATGAGTGTSTSNLCGGLADADCTPSAGDTIYLCGAFTTQLAPQNVNGTAGNVITYDFDCSGNPATLTFDASADRGLYISSKSYLTINNARVTGATGVGGSNDTGLLSIAGSTHIILNSPTTYNNTAASAARGLSVRSSSDVTINDAVSYGNYGHGIIINNDSTRITVDGFTTYNNRRTGLQFEGFSTHSSLTNSSASNGLTYGNGNGCYAIIGDQIQFHDIVSHHNDNILGDGEGYGCAIQQVTNAEVYNMTIYDNRVDGIEVWGNAALSASGCRVYSNKVYNHTYFTVDDSGSNGIEVRTGYSPGCFIYGNLLFNNTKNFRIGNDSTGTSRLTHNTTYGGTYSLRMVDSNEAGTNATTGWTIANNIFDSPSSHWIYTDVTSANSNTLAKNVFAGSKSVTYNNTVYTSANISTVDSLAVTTSPAYVWADRTAAAGYRLTPGSALTNASTPRGPCADARGRACPSDRPNIGAYQSTSGDPAATRATRN